MIAAAVPFDQQLQAVHLLADAATLGCPRGVPIVELIDHRHPEIGSRLRVHRCNRRARHRGRCHPDLKPRRLTTICGLDVTGTWIDWPRNDGPPCPTCHGTQAQEQLV